MYELLKKADKLTDIGKAEEALEILREIENSAGRDFLEKEGAKTAELFGAAFAILGNASKAAAAYLDAAHKDNFLRAQRGHIANYLFILHYLSGINTSELYKELANFENLFDNTEQFSPTKYNHKKIKIGYLLQNPLKSSLSNFIVPLFSEYDKNKFEVCVYTFVSENDSFTSKIKNNVNDFKILDISSYYDAAKTIKDDEIDILFDLTAYGQGGDTLSVLAYRPAPIQIAGIGWPGVCELSFIDYILSDDFLIDDLMKDKPLLLPRALCFKSDADMLRKLRKPKENNSPVILGVFNNFLKITDEALSLWKEILKNLPDAILILQDNSIYEERIKFMKNRLKKLNFTEKVTVKTANENYLYDIANADIVLDTFPYTGGFITATAITLGTPVVTLAQNRFSAKFSADILKAASLDEFITYDKDEYKNCVIKLATLTKNENYRDIIRNKVLQSDLPNGKKYMQNFETALNRIVCEA